MGPLGDSNKMTCQSFIQSGIAHAHVQVQVHASPNVKLFMIYAPQMIIGIGPYPCLTNCPGPRSELDVANLFFVDYIQYVHTVCMRRLIGENQEEKTRGTGGIEEPICIAPTVHEGTQGDPGRYESRTLCVSPVTMIGSNPGKTLHYQRSHVRSSSHARSWENCVLVSLFRLSYCHNLPRPFNKFGYSTDLPSRHSRGRLYHIPQITTV